jgi:hypothetical protein
MSEFPHKTAQMMREIQESELELESIKQRLSHAKENLAKAKESSVGLSD